MSNFFNQISIQYSYKNIDSYLQQRNTLFDSLLLPSSTINQSITENNENLLQIAIICKNIQAIRVLLNKNADINYCNRRYLTSLDIACEQSDYFIIQLLIEKLKSLDKEYFFNNIDKVFNSLNICILNNNISGFQLLFFCVKEKIQNHTFYVNDINYKNNITDTLIHACIHQATDIIQFLLTQNVDINEKNRFERTPLNESCIHKSSLQFLSFLIQNQADLNIKDKFGNTPLLNSIVYRNYKIALFLLKFNSINVNQSNFSSQTPLLFLCQQTNHFQNNKQNIKLLKKLIKKQANLDFQNTAGESSLMILTKNRNYSFIQILMDNGANINLQDKSGNTCLIYSCIYQDSLTLDWFLSLYPDLDIQNEKGLSALMILCQQNNHQLLQQIFKHNIQFNINQQDFQGKTLLMHSLVNLNEYTYLTFILLINQGCQIDIQDRYKKDILHYTLQLYDLLINSQQNTNHISHLNNICLVLFFYLSKYQILFQLQFCLKYYSFYQNENLLYQHLNMMNQKQLLGNFLLFVFLNKKKSDYLTRMIISNNHRFRQLLIDFCYCQLNKQ